MRDEVVAVLRCHMSPNTRLPLALVQPEIPPNTAIERG